MKSFVHFCFGRKILLTVLCSMDSLYEFHRWPNYCTAFKPKIKRKRRKKESWESSQPRFSNDSFISRISREVPHLITTSHNGGNVSSYGRCFRLNCKRDVAPCVLFVVVDFQTLIFPCYKIIKYYISLSFSQTRTQLYFYTFYRFLHYRCLS